MPGYEWRGSLNGSAFPFPEISQPDTQRFSEPEKSIGGLRYAGDVESSIFVAMADSRSSGAGQLRHHNFSGATELLATAVGATRQSHSAGPNRKRLSQAWDHHSCKAHTPGQNRRMPLRFTATPRIKARLVIRSVPGTGPEVVVP